MPGTATPRAATVTPVTGPFDLVDAPAGVMAGDTVLAFVTTNGSLDDVDITGGQPWTIQAEFEGTRLYASVTSPDNPGSYAVELGDGDRGLVGLLHLRGATLSGILAVTDSGGIAPEAGVPCPAASPGVAAGVEVRYCIAGNPIVPITFAPEGMAVEDQAHDGGNTSAFLGARTSLSSAALPVRHIDPGLAVVAAWEAWTLIVAPGDYTPEPPPVPAYAVKGRALYRYTAHDLLSGQYIDDIYPRDPVYSKRLREPGRFSCSLPIPNTRVAAAVRRIIPKLRTDLTAGPGRVQIRIWRDGELRGRYLLTGARLSRGQDGKIAIELRASTLDAVWFSLRVTETLDGSDDEQIDNARFVLAHGLTKLGGDLGIVYQPGGTGEVRPLLIKSTDATSYGRVVAEFSKTGNGFEYFLAETVDESGDVVSTWVWGAPKISTSIQHVFSTSPHGGDIDSYGLDMDALRGGTDWQVRGGTPQVEAQETAVPLMSELVTTAHRAAGWPRIDHLVDHPTQSLDQDELDTLAAYYADVAGGALWVRTVTVLPAKRSTLTMNSLGDYARLLITDVWHEREDGGAGLDISERIIGIEVRPTGKGRGREEVTLTLEAVEVP
ncbi:hypothetical protein ACIBKY_26780 [Nonomuraea sp. NPDC050394]|uniref:hypothetical protein n=1 Tax=Nonomuraea sp. NPDC050394 TaxID=3364363 RepID=UPI003789A7C6